MSEYKSLKNDVFIPAAFSNTLVVGISATALFDMAKSIPTTLIDMLLTPVLTVPKVWSTTLERRCIHNIKAFKWCS